VIRAEIVTHSKKATYHETLMGDDGMTAYVGSRSSRVMLRVYDKAIESKGTVNAIRWELVLRKQAAQAVQGELAVKQWAQLFGAQFLRFVDFRDRSVHSKPQRCPQMTWYAEIVGDVTKARPYMPRPIYAADKSMRHFRRNQAPMLAALVANEGGSVDFIYKALKEGRQRWRQKHHIIAQDQGAN
jgi:hypothetical protein